MVDIYYLDIGFKGDAVDRARQIVHALGQTRHGKGIRLNAEQVVYIDLEDRASVAWKVEYIDYEDRAAALKALAMDLDRIDEGWRACLLTG